MYRSVGCHLREDVAHLSADGAKKIKGRSPIFEGITGERVPVWMSHGDKAMSYVDWILGLEA